VHPEDVDEVVEQKRITDDVDAPVGKSGPGRESFEQQLVQGLHVQDEHSIGIDHGALARGAMAVLHSNLEHQSADAQLVRLGDASRAFLAESTSDRDEIRARQQNIVRARFAEEPGSPTSDRQDDWLERPTRFGQLIDRGRRWWREHGSLDDRGLLHLAQAESQQVGSDARKAVQQV
jgi:hypothetical protein